MRLAQLLVLVACAATATSVQAVWPSQGGYFRQLSEARSGNSTAEQCLTQNLGSVLNSCPDYHGSRSNLLFNATSNMRDAMIRLLQACILGTSNTNATQPTTMRLLLPGGAFAASIDNLTATYQKATGIQVMLDTPSILIYAAVRSTSIQNPTNQSITHEAWLTTPSGLGDGVTNGAFMDLSDLVLYDQRLQWQGLGYQLRSVGLIYGSRVVALPLSSYSYQLLYRMDTFSKNNWTVPHTWRDLVNMAVRINGTNNMWGFCGLWGQCGNLGVNLFKYILASYHQTKGATDGWLIDPDSMHLMLDSPAVAETIDLIRDLWHASPVDKGINSGCTISGDDFVQGNCHMTIAFGTTFKYASYTANAAKVGDLQGNFGVTSVPGSDRVLDRASNTLVPCDNTRCPYATWFPRSEFPGSKSGKWINLSPGFEAVLLALNGRASSTLQFYSYSTMSYLSRPEVSNELVFSSAAELLPSRATQLQPAKWQQAGYNLADSTRYCDAHVAAISHPNLHVQVRMPGSSAFVSLFFVLMSSLMQENATTADIVKMAQPRGLAILNSTFKGNQAALQAEYWSSINKPFAPPSSPSPPPRTPEAPRDINAEAAHGSSKNILLITLCVVLPTLGLLVLGLVFMRGRWVGELAGSTWRKPPGVGPNTTLLVSDIESSTTLWEELDATVMDASAKLHNACIRTLAARNKGYESVWEGDSFVIAFPSALDALTFSLGVQKALLHLEWPAALLAHPSAEEIWVRQQKPTADHRRTLFDKKKTSVCAQKGSNAAGSKAMFRFMAVHGALTIGSTGSADQTDDIEAAGSAALSDDTSVRSGRHGIEEEGATNFVRQRTAVSESAPDRQASGCVEHCSNGSQPSGAPRGSGRKAPVVKASNNTFVAPVSLNLPPIAVRARSMSTGFPARPLQLPEAQVSEPGCPMRMSLGLMGNTHMLSASEKLPIPSLDERAASAFGDTSGQIWTLRNSFQAEWQQVTEENPDRSDAVVAFRGLRVRLGFHSGLAKASDMGFNEASRRYVYTGVIRVAANAVASAGLGGHILMSSATASLLGKDAHGVLRSLPADARVYHMGDHLLNDMPDEPVQLLLTLPRALKCRLGLLQAPLRTRACVGLSMLDAPVPGHRLSGPLVLFALRVAGLDALLAWNKFEAQQAINELSGMICHELAQWRGLLSEDGLSLAAEAPSISGTAGLAGPGKNSTTHGQAVAVFSDAGDAIQCALALRHRLLLHSWSDQLLSHHMCEQVGLMPTRDSSPMHAIFQEVDERGQARPATTSPLASPATVIREISGDYRTDSRTAFKSRLGSIGVARVSPYTSLVREPSDSYEQMAGVSPPRSRTGLFTGGHGVMAVMGDGNDRPSEVFPVSVDSPPQSPTKTSLNGVKPVVEIISPVDVQKVFASEAPVLCGLRLRFAVAGGATSLYFADRSSGRAVYRGGKAPKRLHKLLQQAHLGQLLVAGDVMQQAQQ